MDNPNEPVLVVTTKDHYLVKAGRPDLTNKKELAEYVLLGYKIETMTITKFKKKEWKWIYDKPVKSRSSDKN